MFFLIRQISLYCVPFVRFHDFSDLADVAANVWAISAPKMERSSIFRHIASGILKIGSLEAGKSSFLRRQSESIDDWIICNEIPLELQGKSYEKVAECMVFIQYSCLLPLKFSIVFTIFQISQLPVNRFPKFRMLCAGKLMLSPFWEH